MSKRNVKAKSGKQLYLNQIFYKGMLYTSSEMQEGYCKVIDNFDIAPTGDAASPRKPLKLLNRNTQILNKIDNYSSSKYVYPVKFKQNSYKQSYIKFDRTISEEDFATDSNLDESFSPSKTVHILDRKENELNESSGDGINLKEEEYIYIDKEVSEPDTEDESILVKAYKERVIENDGVLTFANLNAFDYVAKIKLTTNATMPEGIPIFEESEVEVNIESNPSEGVELNNLEIIDGDTFHYNNTGEEQKIRLFGVDTPEKGEQWYEYAKYFLNNLMVGDGKKFTISNLYADNNGRQVSTVKLVDNNNPSFEYNIKCLKRISEKEYEAYVSVPMELKTLNFFNHNINDLSTEITNYSVDLDTPIGDYIEIPSYGYIGDDYVKTIQESDTGYNSAAIVSSAAGTQYNMLGLTWESLGNSGEVSQFNISNYDPYLKITGIGSGMAGSPYQVHLKTQIFGDNIQYIKLNLGYYLSSFGSSNLYISFNVNIKDEYGYILASKQERFEYIQLGSYNSPTYRDILINTSTDGIGVNNPIIELSFTDDTHILNTRTDYVLIGQLEYSNKVYGYTPIFVNAEENQTFKKISFNYESDSPFLGLSVGQYIYDRVFGHLKMTRKPIAVDIGLATLSAGLSTITNFVFDENYKDLSAAYIAASNRAQLSNYKIFSSNTGDFDPFHFFENIIPYLDLENNLQITEDMYIEAVKIKDDYQISAKTSTSIDFIKTIYIDYLDAVAFIGRIVEKSSSTYNKPKIIYKGPILFKCNLDEGDRVFFSILLPSNYGEGKQPSLLDAVSEGYNLINDNLLHIKNDKKNYELISPISASVVTLDVMEGEGNENKFFVSDPVSIVSKGVLGQALLLKAVINQGSDDGGDIKGSGLFGFSGISTTDTYGFKMTLSEIKYNNVILFDDVTIVKNIGEPTTLHTQTYNIDKARKRLFESIEKGDNFLGTFEPDSTNQHPEVQSNKYYFNVSDKKYYFCASNSWEIYDIDWEDIFESNPVINIETFKIIDPKLDEIILPAFSCEYKTDGTFSVVSPIKDCLFEIVVQTQLTENQDLFVNVFNNFDSIHTVFEINSEDNMVTQIGRSTSSSVAVPVNIYSCWYRSNYSESSFERISEEKLLFTKSTTSNKLHKVQSDDYWDWDKQGGIMPTDMQFIPTSRGTYTFKFSMQPKYSIKLGNDCPANLASIELINSFQEMYVTIPMLSIGNEIESVSNLTLKKNLDIKNATRIDIFNRQICLYGPYTKSNVLFFSKFESYDYFPFPYNVIELDEPITYIYNYKDSLIVFGKYNIYMLSGGTTVSECTLNKIYQNLSIHIPDIQTVITSGNNLIFFNNGVGYVIVPNTYVDNASNIKVYKLTENINNFFYNPEEYIRTRIPKISVTNNISFKLSFISYSQNNEIHVICNIEISERIINEDSKIYYLPVWFIYNQDYKYWKMYSTELFDKINFCYISEPNLNNQFIVTDKENMYIAYFKNTYTSEYKDTSVAGIGDCDIVTIINSGYLSVDTMNDKRFKDLIIELDNINPDSNVLVECNFFVDGAPILLSDVDVLVIDKTSGLELPTENVIELLKKYDIYHIGNSPTENDSNEYELISERYGTAFTIGNNTYSSSGRTHVRIPVFGKGRLPSFTLQIKSEKFYEFINYALIYKEKNINRRS